MSEAAPAVPASSIREAASLIVLRDAPQGPEVLLMRRPERGGDFRSGAWVFPGGVLDAEDAQLANCCHGLSEAEANARLGLERGGLAPFVAALRESFEETGLMLACGPAGEPVDVAAREAELKPWRERLHARHVALGDVLQAHGWRLDLRHIAFWAHWLTPPTRPKRFDTRFFVVQSPAGQTPRADDNESLELRWLRPADAAQEGNGLHMLRVTRLLLQSLAGFDSAAQAYATARAFIGVKRVAPETHDAAAPTSQGLPGAN